MSSRAACDCRSHNGFLTAKGLEETAQRSLEGLEVDNMHLERYLDKVGSVSGLGLDGTFHVFDDRLIDEQCLRSADGSS